jgi:hypothetical protein
MKTTVAEKKESHVKGEEHHRINHKKFITPFELLLNFLIRQTESDRRLNLFGRDPLKA